MKTLPLMTAALILMLPAVARSGLAAERQFAEVRRVAAAEAVQGVAVDERAYYAIANQSIGKYDKQTGDLQLRWKAGTSHPLVHLNSGVVVGDRLYCAHSNYPATPATSSVEIWETATLQHVGSRSFGIAEGSLTWIDRYDGSWWACFAHYGPSGSAEAGQTDNRWTTLVQFDDEWGRRQAWVFPPQVLERFGAYSCSGGSWGPGDVLYCTGHDHKELYVLRLPQAGSTLELAAIQPVASPGQGIGWDRSQAGALVGIDRRQRKVVVSELIGD